jgi:very-short-patch-repair endonuclease
LEETPEQREAAATATAAIGGFESLLDTLDAFLPNWLLEWHYRSEDERLITFSNTNIYSGRLVTFPSARGHEAVRHTLVPHDAALGGQEDSASREVEEVVRQVIWHAENRPGESLGVITMGIKHANRIQAALDNSLDGRTKLSDFFSLEQEERFFIKNLETVQGDERDAIILSVGYGKSSNGVLPHRFGPLTQEAGHRRLNVAVTRAKRRMSVISSFSHHEVDLNRSGARGVQLLKAYLDYAASGGQRLPEVERAGEVGLNAFEADVRDMLDARGIVTRPQYGASHYRIDLVAMHPKSPGRPVLAIECDGASYHSSATARDRDRLRQTHLERLGWRFHRIWSTDWFYNREQEIERAVSAFEEAVRYANSVDSDRVVVASKSPSQIHRRASPKPSPARDVPRPFVPRRQNIDEYSARELQDIAEWIVSDGLLRTDEELLRSVFEMLPFRRVGTRIRSRLEHLVQNVRKNQNHQADS